MFHTDDSMKIDDINKVAKRHMVYIWPEKSVFAYTYTWKSWHLVGFEPTLFGRAKVQPHNAYQTTCQSAPSLVASLLSVAAVWLEKYWLDS